MRYAAAVQYDFVVQAAPIPAQAAAEEAARVAAEKAAAEKAARLAAQKAEDEAARIAAEKTALDAVKSAEDSRMASPLEAAGAPLVEDSSMRFKVMTLTVPTY